ncbi:MAG: DUF922 domain-containing protein [Methylobacter sp.]
MTDGQSPALSNCPIVNSPPGSPPHAGFRSAHPQGVSTSTGGPTLSGWPRKIAWSEFREVSSRPEGEFEDAQISVELEPEKNISVERESGRFKMGKVIFKMSIKKSESWVVRGQKSDDLLAHEQGHFDIVGLFYRDLITALQQLRANSVSELGRETKHLMGQYDREADQMSKQYDQDTHHGRNAVRQQAWRKQIQDCIQKSSQFTAP